MIYYEDYLSRLYSFTDKHLENVMKGYGSFQPKNKWSEMKWLTLSYSFIHMQSKFKEYLFEYWKKDRFLESNFWVLMKFKFLSFKLFELKLLNYKYKVTITKKQ